jgi:glycosyltransferase involved in cell wall biosynthesis
MRIGYLIPEFPGQTHIWMWREIVHLREWAVDVRIFSTRRPPQRDRARHAFAADAEAQTTYLWPPRTRRAIASILWALFTRPLRLFRCAKVAFSLPVNDAPRWGMLPLVVPACILAREVKRNRVEHLHAHTAARGAILCVLVRVLTATPFSITLNANIEWWGGAMREKFEAADFTIAITQWLLDQMRREFPSLRPEQALLGRIGVDTRRWKPREATTTPNGAVPRILTLARLHRSKGHEVLIRAVAKLQDQGVNVSLRLAGDGPERESLEKLVAELKLSKGVSFAGSISEEQAQKEMNEADVFVLASHAEPLGVAYMEAMAAGVPTIGTNAGGVPEIIADGTDGLLVPPKDPAALSSAIRRLIDDEALRRRLASAGRRKIEQQFDSRLGAAVLYKRLTGKAPPTVL